MKKVKDASAFMDLVPEQYWKYNQHITLDAVKHGYWYVNNRFDFQGFWCQTCPMNVKLECKCWKEYEEKKSRRFLANDSWDCRMKGGKEFEHDPNGEQFNKLSVSEHDDNDNPGYDGHDNERASGEDSCEKDSDTEGE